MEAVPRARVPQTNMPKEVPMNQEEARPTLKP
jgi:hypothetical protein